MYLQILDYSEKAQNTLAYFVMTKKNKFNKDWAYTSGDIYCMSTYS